MMSKVQIVTNVIISIVIFICIGLVRSEDELLLNPSFEGNADEEWTRSERKSIWSVTKHTTKGHPQYMRYDDTLSRGRTGQQSLAFGPWKALSETALFVSQYRYLGFLVGNTDSALLLSFWSRAGTDDSKRLKVQLDLNYDDDAFLFVRLSPKSSNPEDFVRTCVLIPNYGSVRSVQLHLTIDEDIDETVNVDDVSLRFLQNLDEEDDHCTIYTTSFPQKRNVISQFLRPSSSSVSTNERIDEGITLATQLTKDRLETLEEAATIWQGPISAALLLYGQQNPSELAAIVDRYYKSESLRSFVTFHVVWEDLINGEDRTMYPANVLRNVAIANSRTGRVFYVDVDVVPTFSQSQATKWLTEFSIDDDDDTTKDWKSCQKCVFIAPLFEWRSTTSNGFPRTKRELLDKLKDGADSVVRIYSTISHSFFNFGKWSGSSQPFKVQYVDDMEPYFVAPSSAPLMSDIYRGYGRDKCAYSRDIHAAGYEFYVLPEAFLLCLKDPPGNDNTMIKRSKTIPLRMFQNIAFHRNDLKNDYIRSIEIYRKRSGLFYHFSTATTSDSSEELLFESKKDKQELEDTVDSSESGHQIVDEDGGIGCNMAFLDIDISGIPEMTSLGNFIQSNRKDVLVERLMNTYGEYSYVHISAEDIMGTIKYMLPLMQPESVLSLYPESHDSQRVVNGLFETYRSKGNLSKLFDQVIVDHPGPKIYSINVDKFSESKSVEYILACLKKASDRDIVLIDDTQRSKSREFWSLVFADMCANRLDWKIYQRIDLVLLKSRSLTKPEALNITPIPGCAKSFAPGANFTTDIILFSKNRPLQAFAFFDSLKKQVSGVNKVWLLLKTEDEIFERGYEIIRNCFATYVQIEIIRQGKDDDNRVSFGQNVLNILQQRSTADCVMLAVDEMIWLRPVNLKTVSSLLNECDREEVFSFQLRLGHNIRSHIPIDNHDLRFHPLKFDEDILAFYPRRLPYDFGYVLNVDGVVVRRSDLIEDLEKAIPTCSSPGCVEQSWITHRLHVRSRQWQFMHKSSRVVNNMGMADGRVADRRQPPSDGSFELARILVDDGKKIDVDSFADKHKNNANVHISQPVGYVKMECEN